MRVKVERLDSKGNWYVRVIQGHQSFLLDYQGDKRECLWMAKMFRKALSSHDNVMKERKRTGLGQYK